MNARDALILQEEFNRSTAAINGEISLIKIERTETTGNVAYGYDNAPGNLWADDPGFDESEIAIKVPCKFVPAVDRTPNMTQVGYLESSDLEVEISAFDLERFGIDISNIENEFDFVRIESPSAISSNGRFISTQDRIWDIASIRTIGFGDQIILIRLGLRMREVEANG